MKGVGLLRALGDPTPVDRADNYSRARRSPASGSSPARSTAATASASRCPYAPFTFIKAIPVGGRYAEPVTTHDRRDPHELKRVRRHRRRRVPAHRAEPALHARQARCTTTSSAATATPTACRSTTRVLAGLKRRGHRRACRSRSRPDGVAGGWKLRGVKLVVNGRTLYAPRRHRALARGRPPHLARAGLPARAAPAARRCRSRSTCGTRTRSSTAATTTATSTATTTAAPRRSRTPRTRVVRDRATGRQLPQRPHRRRRPGVGHLHDRDADADARAAAAPPPVLAPVEPPPPPPPPPGPEAGPRDQRRWTTTRR